MKSKLKIAGAALNQTPIDWKHNTTNILQAISKAEALQADILCLGELCLSGYGCEDLFLSEWLPAQAWQALSDIVPLTGELIVCIGLPIRIGENTYNGVCVVQNKTILGITLKQNLARDGVHYEPRWFDPWPAGTTVEIERGGEKIKAGDLLYECKGVVFGFEICEDAWRQTRPAASLCHRGADLILNPSASHFALGKSPSREQLVKDSSARYQCAYGYVNLLGNEAGRMIYDGDILFARHGKIIQRSPRLSFSPCVVAACEIDFGSTESTPAGLQEELMDSNEEFAQATTLALFDYLRKSKSNGFVLSLSGGADSACCAVLVAEMVRRASRQLGWQELAQTLKLKATGEQEAVQELLTCVYQATQNSSAATLASAQLLASSLGANFYHWQVNDEAESYKAKIEHALGYPLTWEQNDIALQNIQARARSPIVWLLANVKNCILLTASNRSEGDVGYATMDGDTSGSLAPIAGIDKPFIRQWLKWAEKELLYAGLQAVNNLQPTAELRPYPQTDEEDLMPYDLLVAIEKLAIRDRKHPVEVYHLLTGQYPPILLKPAIKKFFRLWAINQWKRERLAPSFHLDDLNIDPRSWCRFPILSANFLHELSQLDRI